MKRPKEKNKWLERDSDTKKGTLNRVGSIYCINRERWRDREKERQRVAGWLADGLSPEKCDITEQSHQPAS